MNEAVAQALSGFCERPEDDARRQVLGDALAEAGDPRGEYVVLCRARETGRGSTAASHRADALLKQHRAIWTRELENVFRDVEFSGGFPYRARLGDPVEEEVSARVLRSSAASTLRHVSQSGWTPPPEFFEALPMLESLTLGQHGVDAYQDRPWAMVALDVPRITTGRLFATPKRLVLRDGDFASLQHAVELRQLEHVTVVDDQQRWGGVIRLWSRLSCRELWFPPNLEVRRDPDGETHVRLHNVEEVEARRFGRGLPAWVRRVTVLPRGGQFPNPDRIRAAFSKGTAVGFLRP